MRLPDGQESEARCSKIDFHCGTDSSDSRFRFM